MSVITNKFADELTEKGMRDAYLDSQTRAKLAQQIRAMRAQRGWSQEELGRRMGKPQANIARLEDRQVARYTLSTLIELASAFDVAIIAKFATYEEFLRDTGSFNPDALKVESFSRSALIGLCREPHAHQDIDAWYTTLDTVLARQDDYTSQPPRASYLVTGHGGHVIQACDAGKSYWTDVVQCKTRTKEVAVNSLLAATATHHFLGIFNRPQAPVAATTIRAATAEISRLRTELDTARTENDRLRSELDSLRSKVGFVSEGSALNDLGDNIAPYMIPVRDREGVF